jgi:cytochrome c-type biogenesis protein CcmE
VSPQAQKRIAAIGALAVAAGILSYVAFGGIEQNLVYFWDVTELLGKGPAAYGASVRLGGFVEAGTLNWSEQTLDLKFKVAASDKPGGPTVIVHARGAPPQMFREGIGVVVEGKFDGSVFSADRVIVKHNNEYKPPKAGERPQELYKTLVDES